MPLYVAFQQPGPIGDNSAQAIGDVRTSEAITAGNTGAKAAQDGEIAFISNTESSPLYVAHGKVPDTSATDKTVKTTARYLIPASSPIVAVSVKTGDKFAAASVS